MGTPLGRDRGGPAMVPEQPQMPQQPRNGRLHRPTVALVVLAITTLLIPLLKRSKDHELTSSDFAEILLAQAQALYPHSLFELQQILPMATLSAMALFHAVAHDVAGVGRDGYKRWTAFTRYCESRVIMNAMAALNVWAAQAQTVETAITTTGFQLETSNLISVALVVQHYLLTHPQDRQEQHDLHCLHSAHMGQRHCPVLEFGSHLLDSGCAAGHLPHQGGVARLRAAALCDLLRALD